MVKILNCYLYARKVCLRVQFFFGHPCIIGKNFKTGLKQIEVRAFQGRLIILAKSIIQNE